MSGRRPNRPELRDDPANVAHRTAGYAGIEPRLLSYLESGAMDNFGYEVFASIVIGALIGFLLTAVLLPW